MIEFYNKKNGKVFAGISIEGLFNGEIKATKELLSYEKNIPIGQIGLRVV